MLELKQTGDGIVFKIRVQPRASKNELAGLHGDSVKIRLTAPPVEGEANKACIDFLATLLQVSRSNVEIIAGHKGRNKTVKVIGVKREVLLKCLGIANK